MFGFLQTIFDTILPLKKRAARTSLIAFDAISIEPVSHALFGIHVTTLLNYRDPITEDLIRSLKYESSSYAATLCSMVLSDFLHEEIAAIKTYSSKRIFLVPIPLHGTRLRERGFNQIEIVLRQLPKKFQGGTLAALLPNALERVRETAQQTRLSRAERLKNVSGAFAVHNKEKLNNTHVFLLDDVATTGATLSEATRVLQNAGASVTPIALARA